jgi:protein-tyrosine-phosphatase
MIDFELEKINDFTIKPYKNLPKDVPLDQVQGGVFLLHKNIAIIAKTNSGKSVVVSNILEKCTNKASTVFIISSTVDIDKTYKELIKRLEKKNIPVFTFHSINEVDENNQRVNTLDLILDMMEETIKEENETDSEESEDEPIPLVLITNDDNDEKKTRKIRKTKYVAPRFWVVLDDVSNELKDVTVEKFLKKCRHYSCSTIISNQSFVDLSPASRKQFYYWVFLGGHRTDKLKLIYPDLDQELEFDEFYHLYKHATKDKYNFLTVSKDGVFRRNLNQQYKIKLP